MSFARFVLMAFALGVGIFVAIALFIALVVGAIELGIFLFAAGELWGFAYVLLLICIFAAFAVLAATEGVP